MKRRVKTQKQLNREREIERDKKRKEFEARYHKLQDLWKEAGVDRNMLADSQVEFVERKLGEWEQEQLKIPTGRYRDEEWIGFYLPAKIC